MPGKFCWLLGNAAQEGAEQRSQDSIGTLGLELGRAKKRPAPSESSISLRPENDFPCLRGQERWGEALQGGGVSGMTAASPDHIDHICKADLPRISVEGVRALLSL